jgi:uncharacterized membrane protein
MDGFLLSMFMIILDCERRVYIALSTKIERHAKLVRLIDCDLVED